MGRLEGKVAIITGAGQGLGRADALALAREGAKLLLTDIALDKVQAVVAEIGSNAFCLEQDVSIESHWIEVIAAAEERFGKVNVLVNNAGLVIAESIEETTAEHWHLHQRVMSDGVFFGCKHVLPAMRRAGSGSIINVSSSAALHGFVPYFAYTAAKGAVRAMTKSIAVYCLEKRLPIRANSIHPGPINTAMVRSVTTIQEDEPNPAQGLGRPEDVGNLVLFLASDESRHINGAELVIDNGIFLQGDANALS